MADLKKQLKDFKTIENSIGGSEYVFVSQNGKTRKTTINDVKNFAIGTEDMGTSATTIKGAIKEHGEGINNIATQLNATTKVEDEKLLKGVLYSASSKSDNSRIETDIIYYQAVVKNPIGSEYSNMPIGIKCGFSQGECPSLEYIVVKKLDGTTINYQWEGEIHPNPMLKNIENLSTYPDGSLKYGTLWIMDTIEADAQNVYIIEVHSNKVTTSQLSNIGYSENKDDVSHPKDIFNCNNIQLVFDHSLGYQLTAYSNNGTQFNCSGNSVFMPYFKSTTKNYDAIASNNNIVKSINGTGTIFYDYIVEATSKEKAGIKIVTTYRIFSNGLVSIKSELNILSDLNAGDIIQFGLKARVLDSTDRTYSKNKTNASFLSVLNSDNSKAVNYQVVKSYLSSSILNMDSYTTNIFEIADSSSGYVGLNVWLSCDTNYVFKKGSYNMIKSFLIPFNDSIDYKCLNLVKVNATRRNLTELKQRYFSLCKKFCDHMSSYKFNSYFKGLNAYANMAYSKLNDVIREYSNIESLPSYINALTTKYGDPTNILSWQNKWKGDSSAHGGIEFIGRDTAPIMFFRKLAKDNNKTNSLQTLERTIHTLADFYVWLENYSGGNGAIKLQSYSDDTMNSEAAAMKMLKNSLSLEPNTTRESCYNRIKRRFDASIKFKNIIPYNASSPIWSQGLFHYHCFTIFEYLGFVDTPEFDTSNYINSIVSPSGKIDEIGSEFTPDRFGFIHTSL